MGQDPSDIREEIEQTRADMGETVEALGSKADVKGRAKQNVAGKVETVRSKLGGASDAAPDSDQVKQGAKRAAGIAQENPLGLAVGSLAAGFLIGLAMPSTSMEDERIGPIADDVKDKAKETGQEALDRGKQVAQQAAETAKETAKEAGQEQAQEMRSSQEGSGQPASPAGTPAG